MAQHQGAEVESPPASGVRRRTPAYEMHHVARARSHTGETPRVPRAYGALRSRARADDAMPVQQVALAGTPISPVQPAPEVSTPIPVVVDGPTPTPADVPVGEPGARDVAFAPRLERRDTPPPARHRSWLVALALVLVLVLVAGAVVYLLLRP